MTERTRIIARTRKEQSGDGQDFSFSQEYRQPGWEIGAVREYRDRAREKYFQLTIPNVKDEAWRRTDIRGLGLGNFQLPSKTQSADLPEIPEALLEPVTGQGHGGQVILNSETAARIHLDEALVEKGVVFTDFITAEKEHPQIISGLIGKIVKPEEGKFAALAAAFGQNGIFLYVPRGVIVQQPLHSLIWGAGAGLSHLTHVLVWLEEDAEATYVHETASPDGEGGQTLHSGIVEIYVGENAKLNFVELQSWGDNVWNFTHERAHLDRNATLEWVFGAIGSRLTKNFSDLDLAGAGSTGRMSGFYFANGEQHLDHDTQQNHLAPNTTSDLLYKGALRGKSRSVWQGMIYVAPEAVKADGYQANRNLVLSSNAHADSIPGLEILADDVRCTHGATVGKIDQEQVFYLLSRGIPKAEAERLIVEGFFEPIMQRIPFEGVRNRFQSSIHQKLNEKSEQEIRRKD